MYYACVKSAHDAGTIRICLPPTGCAEHMTVKAKGVIRLKAALLSYAERKKLVELCNVEILKSDDSESLIDAFPGQVVMACGVVVGTFGHVVTGLKFGTPYAYAACALALIGVAILFVRR